MKTIVRDAEHQSDAAQPQGRKIHAVLASLRSTLGPATPSYGRFWARIQDGTIEACRLRGGWLVTDDDAAIAAKLGLTVVQAAA